MNRFLGLLGLFAILALASCEVESAESEERLNTWANGEGTTTSPEGSKD